MNSLHGPPLVTSATQQQEKCNPVEGYSPNGSAVLCEDDLFGRTERDSTDSAMAERSGSLTSESVSDLGSTTDSPDPVMAWLDLGPEYELLRERFSRLRKKADVEASITGSDGSIGGLRHVLLVDDETMKIPICSERLIHYLFASCLQARRSNQVMPSTHLILHSSRWLFRLHSSNRACRSWCGRLRSLRCSRSGCGRCLHWSRCTFLTHLQKSSRHACSRRHTQKSLSSHALQRFRSSTNIASQVTTPDKSAANNTSQHTESPRVAVRNARLGIPIPGNCVRDGAELLSWPYRSIVRFARFLRLGGLAEEHIADKQRGILLTPVEQCLAELNQCGAVFVLQQ